MVVPWLLLCGGWLVGLFVSGFVLFLLGLIYFSLGGGGLFVFVVFLSNDCFCFAVVVVLVCEYSIPFKCNN